MDLLPELVAYRDDCMGMDMPGILRLVRMYPEGKLVIGELGLQEAPDRPAEDLKINARFRGDDHVHGIARGEGTKLGFPCSRSTARLRLRPKPPAIIRDSAASFDKLGQAIGHSFNAMPDLAGPQRDI